MSIIQEVSPRFSPVRKPENVLEPQTLERQDWKRKLSRRLGLVGPAEEEVSSPLPRLQIPSLECN